MTPAAVRILEAASSLFYECGITGVGVELVAEQAGTTKKTIYDRFGSKDGLVVAYLEERARRWQEHADAVLARSRARGARRVLSFLAANESWLAESPRGCGFVNAYAELSTRSERATAAVRAEKQWVRQTYRDLSAEAGVADPDRLARQLAVLHEGATVSFTAGGSDTAFDDARTAMRALLTAAGVT